MSTGLESFEMGKDRELAAKDSYKTGRNRLLVADAGLMMDPLRFRKVAIWARRG